MRQFEEREISVGPAGGDARGITGARRVRLEVFRGGLVRSDAVFAVRYSDDGRIYRRALVGHAYNPRVRSVDFPPFRGVAAELVGWAARPDLGPAFARGVECDADPINNDPDYASDARARADDLDLDLIRARANLTEWGEERRLTGDSPAARNGWTGALAAFDRANGAVRARDGALAGALGALGIAAETGRLADADDGVKRYRVVIHTSYEETYEVAYDGDPEDLYSDDSDAGTWTRVSSKDVGDLEECGMQVQSVEEIIEGGAR